MSSDQYNVTNDQGLSFGTKRVWSKDGKWLGTSFNRSIGDTKAKALGVGADPECAMISMPRRDSVFVLGSDGIYAL